MADLKISALPASSTPLAGTEILPIVQSATTKQVSVANLTAGRAVSALSLTSTNDATLSGLTVGRGGGADATNTAVGSGALAATNTGGGNTGVGVNALNANLGGIGNTASGLNALVGNTSGNYNVASGYLALSGNLSGGNNIGIGYSALSTGTANSNNVGIGYEALKVTSGSTNTAIGYQSGIAMTTGTKNVILGSYSGNTGTLDIRINNNNIVLSDGDGNVRAWWDNANARFYGTLLATGITNSALTSGRVTYAGTSGVLQDSANLLYSGGDLTVYGINVGRGASAVATNTVLGATSLTANTTGLSLTAVGYESMFSNLTGVSNSGFGRATLYSNQSGSYNTSVGQSSLFLNVSGGKNTAIGYTALFNNTVSNNTAVGYEAGYTNSTGGDNTFVGYGAGFTSNANNANAGNTCIGSSSGYSLTTGIGNTFIGGNNPTGYPAGFFVTQGSKNVVIGGYGGNNNGLDIRIANNYIVVADGDGNRQITMAEGQTLALDSAVPNAGTGITFPATQSASSNANTLDDYEEGTWPATFVTDGGSVTTSATIRYGFYTKIGNQVTVTCQVAATAISSPTGGLYIVTLPFVSSSTIGMDFSVSVSGNNFGALAATALVGNIPANSSYIQINSYSAGAQSLMATNLTATSTVTITATYFV